MSSWISIGDLESAINRARAVQPASGVEGSLTREVATLGGLYGRLIWERAEGIDMATLSDAQRVAIELWVPAGRLSG